MRSPLHLPRRLGQGAAQAVQPRNHNNVARTKAREQLAQLGVRFAVLHAGRPFYDLLASCLGQHPALCISIAIWTESEVADQHGATPPDEADFKPGLV